MRVSNLTAFLRLIRQGESSQEDIGYRLLVFNGLFQSFADHPRIHFDRVTRQRIDDWKSAPPNSTTSAAGAYQIVETTFDSWCKATGPHGFTPEEQDACALWLISQHPAAEAEILAGKPVGAAGALGGVWTSLASMTYETIVDVFTTYGGVLQSAGESASPTPVSSGHGDSPAGGIPAPASSTNQGDLMGLILALLPTVIGMIPQLAGIFGKNGERAQQNMKVVQAVADTITTVTGTPNVQAAIEKMSVDAPALDAAKAAVMTHPLVEQLIEFGSGGVSEARRVAFAPGNEPFWKAGAFWISMVMIPLIYMVTYKVLWGQFSEQLQTVVVTAILSGLLGAITGFFFGAMFKRSSSGSEASGG